MNYKFNIRNLSVIAHVDHGAPARRGAVSSRPAAAEWLGGCARGVPAAPPTLDLTARLAL
jgi:hypothetical protein